MQIGYLLIIVVTLTLIVYMYKSMENKIGDMQLLQEYHEEYIRLDDNIIEAYIGFLSDIKFSILSDEPKAEILQAIDEVISSHNKCKNLINSVADSKKV